MLLFVQAALAGEHGEKLEEAHAAHPPAFSMSNGVTYTLASEHDGAAVMTVHGLRFAVPVGDRFKWSAEGGAFVAPKIEHEAFVLELGPYAQTGPGVIVSERFQMSLYGTWKAHGHEETEHLLGAAIAPTFVTPGGNVNIPLGFQCPVGQPLAHCVGVVSVKAATNLGF